MGKDLKTQVIMILAVIAAAVYFTYPPNERIKKGLDLQGGMHIVLKVETEKLEENARKDAVLRGIEIIRNRIDSLGAAEPVIQRQGENEILVQLPGITDRDSAVKLLGQTAQLEFRLVNENPTDLKLALEGATPAGYVLKEIKKEGNQPILLEDKTALSGETLSDAQVDVDQFRTPQISFTLNSEGSKTFGNLTRDNVGRRLAILLDGQVLSAPVINEAITGGTGVITGQFTFDEASLLALALRSGALPAPMYIEEERTIGPTLGEDSINAGKNATIIGGVALFAFMLVYYLTAGLISNVALALNVLLIFGTMGFVNAMLPASQLTLTLPGIAGIILTLGMAVDANILINERIREELDNERPLKAAVNSGYNKALRAIIDSNATTLIAAFMLFQFGSGPIKGFAVTLSLGLLVSMFTSVFVTKAMFNFLLELKILKKLPMLRLFSATNINFISKRYFCYVLSAGLIIASVTAFITKKDSIYGIDFAGGQIQEYKFEKSPEVNKIRATMKEIGLEDAVIQQFAQEPENVMIRTSDDTYDKVVQGFKSTFPDNKFEVLRIEKVGPVVGEALRKAALFAIIFALGGILIYVGFRFKHFDFATAGVIALLHDVIVTFGILIMIGRQIDLLVVTALLTIAGYSINDTIIIYDRVRENLQRGKKDSMENILNLSINQTLGRTILTTFATFIVVVALYLKGGEVLNTFALTLIIGFITGSYSTIYVVSPLVLAWQKRKS